MIKIPEPKPFDFHGEKPIFKPIDSWGKRRCQYCKKWTAFFYNDDYEIMLEVCSNPKCKTIYSAFDYVELNHCDIDINTIELIGYDDD